MSAPFFSSLAAIPLQRPNSSSSTSPTTKPSTTLQKTVQIGFGITQKEQLSSHTCTLLLAKNHQADSPKTQPHSFAAYARKALPAGEMHHLFQLLRRMVTKKPTLHVDSFTREATKMGYTSFQASQAAKDYEAFMQHAVTVEVIVGSMTEAALMNHLYHQPVQLNTFFSVAALYDNCYLAYFSHRLINHFLEYPEELSSSHFDNYCAYLVATGQKTLIAQLLGCPFLNWRERWGDLLLTALANNNIKLARYIFTLKNLHGDGEEYLDRKIKEMILEELKQPQTPALSAFLLSKSPHLISEYTCASQELIEATLRLGDKAACSVLLKKGCALTTPTFTDQQPLFLLMLDNPHEEVIRYCIKASRQWESSARSELEQAIKKHPSLSKKLSLKHFTLSIKV